MYFTPVPTTVLASEPAQEWVNGGLGGNEVTGESRMTMLQREPIRSHTEGLSTQKQPSSFVKEPHRVEDDRPVLLLKMFLIILQRHA